MVVDATGLHWSTLEQRGPQSAVHTTLHVPAREIRLSSPARQLPQTVGDPCRPGGPTGPGDEHEAHIPAEHPPSEAQARLPVAHAHPQRARDRAASAGEGPERPFGVGRRTCARCRRHDASVPFGPTDRAPDRRPCSCTPGPERMVASRRWRSSPDAGWVELCSATVRSGVCEPRLVTRGFRRPTWSWMRGVERSMHRSTCCGRISNV